MRCELAREPSSAKWPLRKYDATLAIPLAEPTSGAPRTLTRPDPARCLSPCHLSVTSPPVAAETQGQPDKHAGTDGTNRTNRRMHGAPPTTAPRRHKATRWTSGMERNGGASTKRTRREGVRQGVLRSPPAAATTHTNASSSRSAIFALALSLMVWRVCICTLPRSPSSSSYCTPG